MKNLALSLSVAAATAVPASAAVYKIDTIIESNSGGFGSSGFHGQEGGQMSGDFIEMFDSSFAASGWWDSTDLDGENISFSGKLQMGGGDVSAVGELLFSTLPSRPTGVYGSITFTVTNSMTLFDGVYEMVFGDQTLVGPSGAPIANAISNNNEIGLWGDFGDYANSDCSVEGECLGIDLRLGVSEVPLPASALLLLGGIGGLGAMRKLRKKS